MGRDEEQKVPPLVKRNIAVAVNVDLVKEPVEPPHRHGQPGSLERFAQLILVEPAVVVTVDGTEEQQQLALGGLDKSSEF